MQLATWPELWMRSILHKVMTPDLDIYRAAMTIYITQGRYTRDAITGMINKPEDRAKAVAALATAAGAKLLSYYVTFGDYDFLVIMDGGKDPTKTMAALMTATSTGGVTDLKTTIAVLRSVATPKKSLQRGSHPHKTFGRG